MRMIDLNRKRHHDHKLKHRRESHIEVRALQRQLQAIRDQISAERGLLATMRQEKKESQEKLKATEAQKIKHIGELEGRHRSISTGVSDLLDTIRDQRGSAQNTVHTLESEVSVLSNRLARENDNYGTECKALGNLTQRIDATKRTNAGEMLAIRERLKDARTRYRDTVMMLTSAWQFAREQILLKQMEEEQKAAEEAEAEAATKQAGPAKGRKGSPKKGGKGKAKGIGGKGKGKKGAKEEEQPAATAGDAQPVFETAPDL
jgi:chromosome segregation ATPase